ncbi:urate hydroxylase PuuD [Marinomonas sp. 15G1-11]|uniref:Urate hydroxylase PuuD n=1 Tax=Marinomonas phaeophyticola TaxID=3004091 RepID=A0ABT4JXJ1_9GAMM|nr:urate hydroxylase PuuD [Marinomonas sp. 15G1-11]MCZ2722936.1 urate hydroxylase PuuD [Marinomonas sp. 15G1-11]
MLESHLHEWLNLFVRWFHITAGIAWIGASFYFNWLENNLVRTGPQKNGISGYLWAIHGGGIYRLEKYKTAPEKMPKTLHWFKWEAYTTWLSGMGLLIVQYYFNASLYLIDPSVMDITPTVAVMISVACIVASWVAYHTLSNMLENKPMLLSLIGLGAFMLVAYGLTHVFSGRGAFINMGAMIGTMMVANVAHVIMPSQKALLAAVEKGETVDPKYGAKALLRSRHNNYLTLPILFIMISNHYPSTYGSDLNWLILIALIVVSAGIRHYFNIRHKPEKNVWILPFACLCLLSLAWVTQPKAYQPSVLPVIQQDSLQRESSKVNSEVVQGSTVLRSDLDRRAHVILVERCASCHSAQPSSTMFSAPPAGVMFDTKEQIQSQMLKIYQQAVLQKTMPLGNLTKMLDEERDVLARWFQSHQ